MRQGSFEIIENTAIAAGTRRLVLGGDASAVSAPGQFVQIALPGRFLRRPLSVCDWDAWTLTLIFKTVGEGTAELAELPVGTSLDVLTGLGNGFDTVPAGDSPLLVGGGAGAAPMYALAKRLKQSSERVTVILGFRTGAEVFLEKELERLGVKVYITTEDGSRGVRGFVTDALSEVKSSFTYACGPMPMLRALARAKTGGMQLSLEERMGCGFGVCMGCTVETKNGPRRVCADGPVFDREELPWLAI